MQINKLPSSSFKLFVFYFDPVFCSKMLRLVKTPERSTIKRVINEVCETFNFFQNGPIPGVFTGKWGGNGPVIESLDPTTNTLIARIKTATEADFTASLPQIRQAQHQWRMVQNRK